MMKQGNVPKNFRHRRHGCAAAICLLLTACALPHDPGARQSVLSDSRLAIPADLAAVDSATAPDTQWPHPQWWRQYGDPQLDGLIEAALAQSPTLAVVQARERQSKTLVAQAEASEGLMVGLDATLDRQSVSQNGFLGPFSITNPQLGTTGPWYTEGSLGLGAEYSVDLWGKNRARVEASMGVHEARQAELRHAELLLSTEIAHTYIGLQGEWAQQAVLAQSIRIAEASARDHRAKADQGLEPRAADGTSQARALELNRQLTISESNVLMARERLRELCGLGPDGLATLGARPLPDTPTQLPSQLGYELLARRPDLQALQASVRASLSQIDAAKAAFYPSFDIRAFAGLDSLHLDDLLKSSSRQYNLIPGLSLPVFDSGRLNAHLAGARAQSDIAIAQYNEVIVRAVREVAQASVQAESLKRQRELQAEKLERLQHQLGMAQAQRAQGLLQRTAADEASLPLLQERSRAITLQTAQWQNRISLVTALGGGYEAPVPQRRHGASTN